MPDKNGGRAGAFEDDVAPLLRGGLVYVLCEEAILKAAFLARAVRCAAAPVTYIDTDLMYSGLLSSGILCGAGPAPDVRRPEGEEGIRAALAAALRAASGAGRASVVVVDSLNGLYGMCGDGDGERLATARLMLLALAAGGSGSTVILAGVATPREDGCGPGRWALAPAGRRIAAARPSTRMRLRRAGGGGAGAEVDLLGEGDAAVRTIAIPGLAPAAPAP